MKAKLEELQAFLLDKPIEIIMDIPWVSLMFRDGVEAVRVDSCTVAARELITKAGYVRSPETRIEHYIPKPEEES